MNVIGYESIDSEESSYTFTFYVGESINCVYADGALYDIYQVTSGTSTCARTDANSCR